MNKTTKAWKAFVLMPFEDKFDLIYRYVLVPALKDVGFEVSRADSTLDQRNMIKDIIESIDMADLVIAEITTLNPNVMWELGVAHALFKPTLQLTLAIENAPFDLKPYRMIPYSTSQEKVKELQEKLKEIGIGLKKGDIIFENPVSDYATNVKEKIKIPDLVSLSHDKKKEFISEIEKEEMGVLDLMDESVGSMEEISEKISAISSLTEDFSEKVEQHTDKFNMLKEKGAMEQRHAEVKGMASDMISYAGLVNEQLPELQTKWEAFREFTSKLLSVVQIKTEEDVQSTMEARNALMNFNESIMFSLRSTKSARGNILTLREMKISRELNFGVRKTVEALDGVIETFLLGQAYTERIINLFNDKLGVKKAFEGIEVETGFQDEIYRSHASADAKVTITVNTDPGVKAVLSYKGPNAAQGLATIPENSTKTVTGKAYWNNCGIFLEVKGVSGGKCRYKIDVR